MEQQLIDRYAAGSNQLAPAIAGLTREELNAFPVPGTWSIQQIVLHMMESDLIASDRMKRVISMENPLLMGYDETAAAQKLCYDRLDPQIACDVFAKNRLLTAELLRRLPKEAWDRSGIHSERGKVTLRDLVANYAEHLEHHLKFIRKKRELLGKPLN
jgi:uncharacterized damage-inducible protein DinB